jgi:hypothetical protein
VAREGHDIAEPITELTTELTTGPTTEPTTGPTTEPTTGAEGVIRVDDEAAGPRRPEPLDAA